MKKFSLDSLLFPLLFNHILQKEEFYKKKTSFNIKQRIEYSSMKLRDRGVKH